MLGSIIGDIIGSYYEVLEIEYFKNYHKPRPYQERIKIMEKDTPLFTENSSCTDDSILTCSVADCLMNGNNNYEGYLKFYAKRELALGFDKYGRSRFGSGFVDWINGSSKGESYGNGASMRISPIGYLNTLEDVKLKAYEATIPSHNHPESIKGAECIATSIYLIRNGISKYDLKKYIEQNYYILDYDLENLRNNYKFSSKTINSVPQSLFIFLESSSFEDSIRKAISIGGDSDTIACIVGGLSEAYYGLDENLFIQAKPYIKDYMWQVINQFYDKQKILLK